MGKFQPGNKQGKGRPKMSNEEHLGLIEDFNVTQATFRKITLGLLKLKPHELVLKLNNPEINVFTLLIGKIIAAGIKYSDSGRLDFLLNRLIGRVSEKVEISVIQQKFEMMSDDERLLAAKEAIKVLQGDTHDNETRKISDN